MKLICCDIFQSYRRIGLKFTQQTTKMFCYFEKLTKHFHSREKKVFPTQHVALSGRMKVLGKLRKLSAELFHEWELSKLSTRSSCDWSHSFMKIKQNPKQRTCFSHLQQFVVSEKVKFDSERREENFVDLNRHSCTIATAASVKNPLVAN